MSLPLVVHSHRRFHRLQALDNFLEATTSSMKALVWGQLAIESKASYNRALRVTTRPVSRTNWTSKGASR